MKGENEGFESRDYIASNPNTGEKGKGFKLENPYYVDDRPMPNFAEKPGTNKSTVEYIADHFAQKQEDMIVQDFVLRNSVCGAYGSNLRTDVSLNMTSNVVTTVSGRDIDLNDVSKNVYGLDDIVHGLNRVCRFNGQIRDHYSVLAHSICVALLVPKAFVVHALLHDASEAYICDLPSPLKAMLPDYAQIEWRLQQSIEIQFGLEYNDHIRKAVKLADQRAYVAEELCLRNREVGEHDVQAEALVSMLQDMTEDELTSMFYTLIHGSK